MELPLSYLFLTTRYISESIFSNSSEFQKDRSVISGVGAGFRTMTVELLNLSSRFFKKMYLNAHGCRITVTTNKMIKKTDEVLVGKPQRLANQQRISTYAQQPATLTEGWLFFTYILTFKVLSKA